MSAIVGLIWPSARTRSIAPGGIDVWKVEGGVTPPILPLAIRRKSLTSDTADVQRYHDDFNGIIVGAPGIDFSLQTGAELPTIQWLDNHP